MFYSFITTGKSCGNEAPLLSASHVLEGDVQSLEREKLHPDRLKLPTLHRHILDVSELVMSTESGRLRPHTAHCAFAYKLGEII